MFRSVVFVPFLALAMVTNAGCSLFRQPTVSEQLFGDKAEATLPIAVGCTDTGQASVFITPLKCTTSLSVTIHWSAPITQDVLYLNIEDRCLPGGWCKEVVGYVPDSYTSVIHSEQLKGVVSDTEPVVVMSLSEHDQPSLGNIHPDTEYLLKHGRFTVHASKDTIASLGLTPVS